MCVYCVVVFKQKTAYEMRISDWSSDVRSSDLIRVPTMHRGRDSKAPPFVWRNDSKAILGVRQDTMRPSGFALGPLSPIEIPNDGEPHPLPLLKDVAGGLDG